MKVNYCFYEEDVGEYFDTITDKYNDLEMLAEDLVRDYHSDNLEYSDETEIYLNKDGTRDWIRYLVTLEMRPHYKARQG